MKVCACLLLFTVFAYTNTQQQRPGNPDRNINLALETVLEFNNKDHSGDIELLNTVQKFINKVKNAMHENKRRNSRRQLTAGKVDTFTGFLQKAIKILNTYDDSKLHKFFQILYDELRNYQYSGSKFYELTENYETRMIFSEKFDFIRGLPVLDIRSIMNTLVDTLKDQKYDSKMKDFINYLNSLYKQDNTKFQKVLKDLESYSKTRSWTDKDLVKVVREGVRALIFDHYTDLSTNNRKELRERITSFCKYSKVSPTTTGRTKFVPNIRPTKKITTTIKTSSLVTTKKMILSPTYKLKENLIARQGIEERRPDVFYKDISASNMKYKTSDESVMNSIEQSQEKQNGGNTQRYATLYEEEITPLTKSTPGFANVQRFKLHVHKPALKSGKDDSKTTTHTLYLNVTNKSTLTKKKYENHAKSNSTNKTKTKTNTAEKSSSKKINIMELYKQVFGSLRTIGSFSIIDEKDTQTKPTSDNYTIPPKSIRFHASVDSFLEPSTTFRSKNDQTKLTSLHVHTHEELSAEQFQRDLERERKQLRRSLSNKKHLGTQDMKIFERLNYLEKQIEELKKANALRGCPTDDKNRTVKCLSRRSSERDKKYGDAFDKIVDRQESLKKKYNMSDNMSDIVIKKCDKCNATRIYKKVLKTKVTEANKTMPSKPTLNLSVTKFAKMLLTTPNLRLYHEELKPHHHHQERLYHTTVKPSHKLRVEQTILSSNEDKMTLNKRQRTNINHSTVATDTMSTINLTLGTQSTNKMIGNFSKTFPLGAGYVPTDGRKSEHINETSITKMKKEHSDRKSRSHTARHRARSPRVLEFSSPPHYDIFHPSQVW